MTYNVFSGTLNPTHFTSRMVTRIIVFWATVYKTFCHMLSDRCLSVYLYVL